MSWFHNLNRKQLVWGGVLAAVGVLGLLASDGGATAEPAPAEVVTETVTETVTEVVTEDSMAAAEVMSERARLNRVKSNLRMERELLKRSVAFWVKETSTR